MAQVNTGRFDELLRGIFGVRGEWVSPFIAGELVPTVVAEPGNASHHFSRRERLVSWVGYAPVVAGQYGQLRIRNNIDGSHFVILSSLSINATANGLYRITITELDGDLGTMGSAPILRDPRLADYSIPTTGPSSVLTSYGSAVAVPTATTIERVRGLANAPSYFLEPVVLTPGSEITVTNEAIATALHTNFHWLEVPMTQQQMA